jgi:hypothetical protein
MISLGGHFAIERSSFTGLDQAVLKTWNRGGDLLERYSQS